MSRAVTITKPMSVSRAASRTAAVIVMVSFVFLLTADHAEARSKGKSIRRGALIGAGVGLVLTGNGRGAAAGAITGGAIGAMKKTKRKKKRRW